MSVLIFFRKIQAHCLSPKPFAMNMDRSVRQLADIAFVFSLLPVLVATLFPFDFSSEVAIEALENRAFILHFFELSPTKDILSHIGIFLPFGFGLAALLRQKNLVGIQALVVAFVISASLSICLEVLQTLLPTRSPAFIEILANIFGAGLGFLGFRLWGHEILGRISTWVVRERAWLSPKNLGISIVVYTILAFGLTFHLQQAVASRASLSNWDQTFPLLVGNEGTGNRPWLGRVVNFSVADRAISQKEVLGAFIDEELPASIRDSLLVSYQLTGKSNFPDRQMNLADLLWQGPEVQEEIGVVLSPQHWLATTESATFLTNSLRRTSQFTLIATVATSNINQTGPARIISLSSDPFHRNFTLGQEGADLIFRLRTPISGENGTNAQLIVPNIFADTAIHHLVITYDGSAIRAYIDGAQHPSSLKLSPNLGTALISYFISPDIDHTMGYQILSYALIFVPFGIFVAIIGSIGKQRFLGSIIYICSGILLPSLILESILASLPGQGINLENLLLGLILTTSSALLFKKPAALLSLNS
jgi:glycopeptide antibiotics resistance protein